jgi:hypothetical protein
MAKTGLFESQSPEGAIVHPSEIHLKPAPVLRRHPRSVAANLQDAGAMPGEGIEGDEWGAYVTLTTYDMDERGIAYGARALWRQSARSSRRSHDLPGRAGKPSAGRRGTGGSGIDMTTRYAKCKTPKWC